MKLTLHYSESAVSTYYFQKRKCRIRVSVFLEQLIGALFVPLKEHKAHL